MRKFGWLPDTREKHHLVESLLKYFFCVASPDEWERIYIYKKASLTFRVSLAHTQSHHAISAWSRNDEIQAKEIVIAEFDKKKFKDALAEIKELAFLMPDDFTKQLQSICAKCGVAVVFTQHLPKAYISRASRWFQNKPIIQLSGRFATNDQFWFTFLRSGTHRFTWQKRYILENVEGTEIDQDKEDEANTFAAKILLKENELQQIIHAAPLNE
jgi:hypothetical protein